ncbi:uncharacterized protein LOC109863028 [Pseudomyrmex gracilis]|uniref:uncharacterized protein LOC109863028 n=1 Tax=Pseudomyrmex gracilis TaxID=219809 RepID=UPI000994E2B9|nr:uncharacterized protein LOC109863028 [Pseudomyrmex gracilis]
MASSSTICEFEDIFKRYDSKNKFCMEGELDISNEDSKLFYETKTGQSDVLNIWNYDTEQINKLFLACEESGFGHKRELVFDENVRIAKQLSSDRFSFQFNPESKPEIKYSVKQLLNGKQFTLKPYKLNIYQKGGFFLTHKDTIKDKNMIASLVLCLPSTFSGGILKVSNKRGIDVDIDWSSKSKEKKIQWACFFTDCDHSISEVTEGNRITIVYNVIISNIKKNKKYGKLSIESLKRGLEEELVRYINKIQLKPEFNKKLFAYHPFHFYGFNIVKNTPDDLITVLKGDDQIFCKVLKDTGFKFDMYVYYDDIEQYGHIISIINELNEDEILCDSISEEERDMLHPIEELQFVNSPVVGGKKFDEVTKYSYEFGCTGNAPASDVENVYASLILVFSKKETIPLKHVSKENYCELENISDKSDNFDENQDSKSPTAQKFKKRRNI